MLQCLNPYLHLSNPLLQQLSACHLHLHLLSSMHTCPSLLHMLLSATQLNLQKTQKLLASTVHLAALWEQLQHIFCICNIQQQDIAATAKGRQNTCLKARLSVYLSLHLPLAPSQLNTIACTAFTPCVIAGMPQQWSLDLRCCHCWKTSLVEPSFVPLSCPVRIECHEGQSWLSTSFPKQIDWAPQSSTTS